MPAQRSETFPKRSSRGFTLVELLVVIAIISILMTVGAIGIGGLTGGKGVGSAVARAEATFDEARSIAVGNRTRARVLIATELPNARENELRRLLVAYEGLNAQGEPETDNWVLASRGELLPEQVFFSQTFSTGRNGTGNLQVMTLDATHNLNQGTYLYYEFNGEGIFQEPGARFIVGAGVKPGSAQSPMVTSAAKKDFGGFAIWRNGRTSVFRSPDQMNIPSEVREF
jgi:prepilin-type N-terminal cleavage/methylation domain-containing protein